MRKLVLLAAMVVATSAQAAPREAFWYDSNHVVVRDGQGNCLRTSFWTEKDGLCPGAKAPEAKPAQVAKPAAVRPAPAPAAPMAAPIVTKKTLKASELFAFDSAKLTPKAEQEIANTAAEAKSLKSINLVIVEGHTDNIGTAAYNQQLSIKRANAVRDALIKNGVPADKIQAKGYGFDKPVASNKTKDGRAQNRRVEITIDGTK
ncbi:MAG: OmpA family protein [Gammaproteobacteria bacterium]|nr:OmpA family protein [Gammaproteobacteria bacterium]